jgi:hypothetical protein
VAALLDELASIEEAIYDQSFRMLDDQARLLDGLRTRAGTLVGAATVTTAFVGGLASTGSMNPTLDALSWVAVGLYVSVIVLSLVIYAPSRRWVSGHHPRRLLSVYVDAAPPASLSHFRQAIAYYNGRNFDANRRQLTRLSALFFAATVLFVADLVLWLAT